MDLKLTTDTQTVHIIALSTAGRYFSTLLEAGITLV